jgi:hypothetical protein
MSLLSASEIAAVQGIAESGMVTSVAIYHGATTQTDNGQKWGYPASPDLTTTGWLREITPSSAKLDVHDGQTAISETHRLFLRVGTDARTGDKIVIAGLDYICQRTNVGDTYPAALVCWLRRQA